MINMRCYRCDKIFKSIDLSDPKDCGTCFGFCPNCEKVVEQEELIRKNKQKEAEAARERMKEKW